MRPFKGKRYGYIIIPIIVPQGKDFDDFAETTEFKQVARTISALSTQDDRIAEEFRAIDTVKRRTGRVVEIEGDFAAGLKIRPDEFIRKVEARIWERVGPANWRDFEAAREWVQHLGLKSEAEWRQLSMSGKLPPDIPSHPGRSYVDDGWAGMGDWLGTGYVASRLREYRSFAAARKWARSLKLKSETEWRRFCKSGKLPADISASPAKTYANDGWAGMGDWLGTGRIASHLREYRPFKQARAWARSLNLKSQSDWQAFCEAGKLPPDVPSNPNNTYADDGWVGMGDWLGTGRVATHLRKYRPFKRARAWARALNIKSGAEWRQLCKSGKLPPDISASPAKTYVDRGWAGMGDWLGTGTIAPRLRKYRSFLAARKWVRNLKLKSQGEWNQFAKSGKLPSDIPANPNSVYADKGWVSTGDWLGTGTIAPRLRKYRGFAVARKWARGLSLASEAEWRTFTKSGKLPSDIPADPSGTYADKGWAGIGDWLGTGRIATHQRKYRVFKKARAWARSLKLKSQSEWLQFTKSGKLPSDIPANPNSVYADKGWVGSGDWLGTGNIAPRWHVYRAFSRAREWARSLRLGSGQEWRALSASRKLPSDIPASPWKTYADDGWAGMGDWLGYAR